MRTLAVIPARYRSTRLPGKPLAEIAGRTMIEHVYRRTAQARWVERVIVATDDLRIRDCVLGFGGECLMTSPDHPTGTDRVAEAVEGLEAELIVNVQGDEPLIEPEAIDLAIAAGNERRGRAIVSLRKPIRSSAELWDPNVVKVVTDSRGMALYFSRWPIPFVATSDMSATNLRRRVGKEAPALDARFHRHIGLYVYPKRILRKLSRLQPTRLERLERLEQLRALEQGIPVRMETTDYEAVSVDTPADLERVRKMFKEASP